MLTARELHKAGAEVLLIERGPLGGESSWAGGGIISPLYPWRYPSAINVLAQHSKTLYPALSGELNEESGIDCELVTSGLFVADVDEREQALEWANRWHVDMQYIRSQQQIHEIEAEINADIDSGLWMPDVMQIRNPKLIKALIKSFAFRRISYREHSPVENIVIESGRVAGVKIQNQTVSAEKIIIASGAWSAELVAGTREVDIEPVKGQMIMLKGAPGQVKRMVLNNGHYIIPRSDGRILAGSTLEKTGFDKSVSADAMLELKQAAAEVVPALAALPVERQWAGLRPGTEHGVPYICMHEAVEGLYLHAGHYRNGIVLGPASVQLMVELVLGRTPWCDHAPYTMDALH